MVASKIAIRSLAREELGLLTEASWSSGLSAKHGDRLARQAADEVTYLIAWMGALPIGHMLVKWTGPSDEPMRSSLPTCAEIEDFTIVQDLRSHGIGHLMMDMAEDQARRRGLRQIGLGVTLDNPRATVFYERHGFREAGFDAYLARWQYADADGQKHWREESCKYLIKELG